VLLPRGARRDLPRLLSYALEDRLLKDPDTQHLTLSHRRPADDGERDLAGVLVISRERLRSLMAQFAAIGRGPPDRGRSADRPGRRRRLASQPVRRGRHPAHRHGAGLASTGTS
jgi:hypothetical protein